MPCDTSLKPNQTIKQRVEEVRAVVERVGRLLAMGKVTARVGPTGAVAFVGLSETDRDRVTDNCIFRRIMATGSALARAKLPTVGVNRQAIAHGHHSHDGGATWHTHKG